MCSVCKRDRNTRYIDLYPFGSEGLRICQCCENEVSKMVLDLALKKTRERKDEYLERRHLTRQMKAT